MKDSVATYEQRKKEMSYFYSKRLVEEDGIHTKPLDFELFFECGLVVLYVLFIFTLWSCSFVPSN